MNADRVLVIGYGNSLRGDDAVGVHVADALREDARLGDARIITCPQLTPELTEDIVAADLVVLIDARTEGAPGTVRTDPIAPAQPALTSSSHAFDAAQLVELARTVYGVAPPVVVVSIGAVRFGLGDPLSPEVAAAVRVASATVVSVVERARTGGHARRDRIIGRTAVVPAPGRRGPFDPAAAIGERCGT